MKKFVTILILIDGFLQFKVRYEEFIDELVTILILIDGFLQYLLKKNKLGMLLRHNPYFNRWFSAISESEMTTISYQQVTILILIDGFLQ